jgi:hypothetical protein
MSDRPPRSGVCDCPREQLCAACLDRALLWHSGMAAVWGGTWAESVAERHPELLVRPWPPAEGRAREIAVRKLAELAADPRVIEHLLEQHHAGAVRAWARLQSLTAGELERWLHGRAVDRRRETRRQARERSRA